MAIFVIQYFSFLGLTIWDEVVGQGGSGAIEVILHVQKGMTASILNMAASTYIILEGVMLAQWLRERDERKQGEAFDEAWVEGIEFGREETNQNWHAWYEQLRKAQLEGRPFDEPPPVNKKSDKKG